MGSPGHMCEPPRGCATTAAAFSLGLAGQVKPTQARNPDSINLTAYCIGGAGADYVTIINKAHGADAGDAVVTIGPPRPG